VQARGDGAIPAERVTLCRKIVMISAVLLLIALVLFLLILSIIASFAPSAFKHGH
jgi:hypothetical protein